MWMWLIYISADVWNVTLSTAFLSPVGQPRITENPKSQLNVVAGEDVEFTVTATAADINDGSLKYRWQRNGVMMEDSEHVSGTAKHILKITNVQKSRDEGRYRCVVNNAHESSCFMRNVTSKSARLKVCKFLYLCHCQCNAEIQQYLQPCRPTWGIAKTLKEFDTGCFQGHKWLYYTVWILSHF